MRPRSSVAVWPSGLAVWIFGVQNNRSQPMAHPQQRIDPTAMHLQIVGRWCLEQHLPAFRIEKVLTHRGPFENQVANQWLTVGNDSLGSLCRKGGNLKLGVHS